MHGSKKGFTFQKKLADSLFRRKCLIKQVLTPPLVAVSDQSHQLPRRMQCERPWPPRQFKPGFFRRPVALAVIATVAASH